MKKIFIFILLSIFYSNNQAQTLKGKIIGSNGNPIPYSTVYIYELSQGIVADEHGNFQTKLPIGNFTCEVRSIGYETQIKKININTNLTEIQYILPDKPLVLKELIVNPTKDNPANRVMRYAIAHAPFYLYQVSEFSATNYMKGSAKIEKIPGLMKMMIKDKKIESLIGKLLVLESQSEVLFQTPSKYTQKVLAFKSSIPAELTPKGGIKTSTSSIYQADFMDYISPLSPNAFRYYKFKLEDIFANGKLQINKIRVIPKVKNDNLFTGFLYIIENDWNVYAVDLTANEMGTITRYKINYSEVKPKVFLPITYEMNTNIGTMGVKGSARFYSSVKYTSVKVNESTKSITSKENNENITQTTQIKPNKDFQKIEKIYSKEKLTTKDAITLSKLYAKTSEPTELAEQRESLEVIEVEKVKIEVDSLAGERDSLYWENIRKVPLLKEESLSFLEKDTLPPSDKISTTNNSISISLGTKSNKATNLLLGCNIKLHKNINLQYDGLLRGILKEYNFVDGFWLGQKATLNVKTSKTTNLSIPFSAYYTTARHAINWDINSYYDYAPLRKGLFNISIGNTTADVQDPMGTSRLINSFSSLLFDDNIIRFYQKQFVKIENKIDLANGLILNTGVAYENRRLPDNNTDFHFWGNIPRKNYPEESYKMAFPQNSATTASLQIYYTPNLKYKIRNGKKEYLSSNYPKFSLEYKKAIPIFNQTEQANYDRIKLSINQSLKLSAFSKINYDLQAGSYLSYKKLFAPDYKYHATSPMFLTNHSFDNSFQLLDNYSFSSKKWLETHVNLNSEYLFLKRIGFLQTQHFNETLHFSMLWSDQNPTTYIEGGYSIGIKDMGRVGVFAGFKGLKYESVGVKVSLPLF